LLHHCERLLMSCCRSNQASDTNESENDDKQNSKANRIEAHERESDESCDDDEARSDDESCDETRNCEARRIDIQRCKGFARLWDKQRKGGTCVASRSQRRA